MVAYKIKFFWKGLEDITTFNHRHIRSYKSCILSKISYLLGDIERTIKNYFLNHWY